MKIRLVCSNRNLRLVASSRDEADITDPIEKESFPVFHVAWIGNKIKKPENPYLRYLFQTA